MNHDRTSAPSVGQNVVILLNTYPAACSMIIYLLGPSILLTWRTALLTVSNYGRLEAASDKISDIKERFLRYRSKYVWKGGFEVVCAEVKRTLYVCSYAYFAYSPGNRSRAAQLRT